MRRIMISGLAIITLITGVNRSFGALSKEDFKQIAFDQHLGQQISRKLTFQDANGKIVALGDLLNTKPTLLVLGYYHCPMLCTIINDGLIEAMQELRFDVGRDFNVINVSIDPNENAKQAATKKKEYLTRYARRGSEAGWHFLTGDEPAIAELAREAGFHYKYDPESHEYAHPSGFLVLTPEGRISRYFFGVNFEPGKLRSAIIAASKGEKGSLIHQLVILCCRYNPISGKYGQLIMTVVRVSGVASVLILVWWIISMGRQTPSANLSKDRD